MMMQGRAAAACVLAWLLPGAGHLYLGKRAKAVVFFVIVIMMFALGLSMHGRVYLAGPEQPLSYLAAGANLALGPLDLIGRMASYDQVIYLIPSETDRARHDEVIARMRQRILVGTHEYGTTFILTAGLMNILLILDAFDISVGRKP